MNIYEEIGMKAYINAHDTYTVYGGSRMAANTLEAMRQVSEHFVDMIELQKLLGEKIAKLTHNEGAFITNGAAGGLLLASCVCMAEGNMYNYRKLPDTTNMKNEIIVLCPQRNAYDQAIWASGAKCVQIGDADETLEYELEGGINEKTAAVFYFLSSLYARASMKLEKVIEIAHKKGVPVVVDAAAQLPPLENLWELTKKGADLVIFSGGKTLCGPSDSGLILGRKDLIDDCIKFGAPEHGICRFCKSSRENLVGLYIAVKNYVELDHEGNYRQLLSKNQMIADYLMGCEKILKTEIIPYGPVGQTYPRLFIYLKNEANGVEIAKEMLSAGIYIGYDKLQNAIYVSPLNLNDKEVECVKMQLKKMME